MPSRCVLAQNNIPHKPTRHKLFFFEGTADRRKSQRRKAVVVYHTVGFGAERTCSASACHASSCTSGGSERLAGLVEGRR